MELCDLGDRPPLTEIPKKMHAFVVRQDRFGEPEDAWQREIIDTPEIGPLDVLVYVMATGINYNNVWAALGKPVDVIADRQKKGEPEDFHAGGSDCSGIVWAIGSQVTNVKPGDEVVVHSGWWEPDDPWVLSGRDPMLAESTRIWGYQTNYGSYCQFARAQSHQCQPKPKHLTWEAAGSYLLCASTAYRMLMGWPPNIVENGDYVHEGDIILVADNIELRARKAELEATLVTLQLEHNKGLVEDYVAMKIADVRMTAAREELDRINQRLDDMIVRAPQSGTIVSQVSLTQIQDRYVERGKVICRILDLEDIRVTSLISQSQNASPFSDRIQRVELRTAGRVTHVIPGEVTQIFDSGRSELPHPALGPGGGGTIAIAPDDREGRRTLRPQFEIWIDLPDIEHAAYRPMPGQRVYVRFTLETKRPLLFQWIRRLHQVLRERVQI